MEENQLKEPPPPGTPITLQFIEDRRSLGQKMFTRMRGRVKGEPEGLAMEDARWWFMFGWVMRSVASGLPDDPARVEDAFTQFTLGTGESKAEPNGT